jgi:hypothetical protein
MHRRRGLGPPRRGLGPPRLGSHSARGASLQNGGGISAGNFFQRINSWTGSTSPWTGRACSVHRGPTTARTEGGRGTAASSPELGLWPLRCAKARRRGRKRVRGAQGAQLGPHRSSGDAVEAGQRWCRTGRWRRLVRTLLRCGERGKEAGEGVVLLRGGAHLL